MAVKTSASAQDHTQRSEQTHTQAYIEQTASKPPLEGSSLIFNKLALLQLGHNKHTYPHRHTREDSATAQHYVSSFLLSYSRKVGLFFGTVTKFQDKNAFFANKIH